MLSLFHRHTWELYNAELIDSGREKVFFFRCKDCNKTVLVFDYQHKLIRLLKHADISEMYKRKFPETISILEKIIQRNSTN